MGRKEGRRRRQQQRPESEAPPIGATPLSPIVVIARMRAPFLVLAPIRAVAQAKAQVSDAAE